MSLLKGKKKKKRQRVDREAGEGKEGEERRKGEPEAWLQARQLRAWHRSLVLQARFSPPWKRDNNAYVRVASRLRNNVKHLARCLRVLQVHNECSFSYHSYFSRPPLLQGSFIRNPGGRRGWCPRGLSSGAMREAGGWCRLPPSPGWLVYWQPVRPMHHILSLQANIVSNYLLCSWICWPHIWRTILHLLKWSKTVHILPTKSVAGKLPVELSQNEDTHLICFVSGQFSFNKEHAINKAKIKFI